MSKRKILTKAKILNSFHSIKKKQQKKTTQSNFLIADSSVLEENWKGAWDLYIAQTSVLTVKD